MRVGLPTDLVLRISACHPFSHSHPIPTPDIETIESGAFDGLDSLWYLDLYNNGELRV